MFPWGSDEKIPSTGKFSSSSIVGDNRNQTYQPWENILIDSFNNNDKAWNMFLSVFTSLKKKLSDI